MPVYGLTLKQHTCDWQVLIKITPFVSLRLDYSMWKDGRSAQMKFGLQR